MAEKGRSSGPGRSASKSDRGGSSTLGSGSDFTSYGPARGYRDGGRDDQGNKIGAVQRGGLFGGFFNPSRLAGVGIGTLVGGPIGGLIGGLIGGGFTSPRDLVDGGGPGASGPQFQGGLISGLLNRAGVSPLGQGQRAQMAASPSLAPQGTRPLPAGATPAAGGASSAASAAGGVTPTTRSFASIPQSGPVRSQTRPLTASDVVRLQSAGRGFDAQVGLPATPEEIMFLDARVPSATDRYMSNYGMTPGQMSAMTPAAPAPQAPPANPELLPRAAPDIGELERYLSGQPEAMTSVAQPGMNVMPDGETFLRQNIAVIPAISNPMATVPQTDLRVGGRYAGMRRPMPQIESFPPLYTSTTPAPAVNPMSAAAADRYLPPDPFRANQLRAYRDMQAREAAGLLGR